MVNKKYSDDDLYQILVDKYLEFNRLPTKDELQSDKTIPSYNTFYRRLGDFTEIAKALEINPNRIVTYTINDYIAFAQKFFTENGKPPTMADFDFDPNYPHSRFRLLYITLL